MDVRDKLIFEPEYAGNSNKNIPPKSALQIPWAWLAAALCLLQEVYIFVFVQSTWINVGLNFIFCLNVYIDNFHYI